MSRHRQIPSVMVIVAAAMLAVAASSDVSAAGGGGGGGGAPTGTGNTVLETCSQDVWSCGEWGACGLNGQQVRECRKTVDCPTTESPEPSTVRSCASSPTPAPAPEPAPAPKPVPISPPLSEGEREGVRVQTRGGSDPSRPQLICGNLPMLAERVRCRIGLDKEALERELTIQYLPEECRTKPEGQTRTRCIERYRALRPCWAEPIGPKRLACVRGMLGLRTLQTERSRCEIIPKVWDIPGDPIRALADCRTELRQKAYPYVTFRFYDLEERAEGLKELGAPLDLVVKFVVAAEQGKQDFNAARSKSERIVIIRRVQSEWRTFVAALPDAVKTRARTEGVGSSY